MGGGWFGWSLFRNGEQAVAAVEEEIDPPVTIPDIPAELEPVMREVAVAAKADWIATLRDSVPVQLGGWPSSPTASGWVAPTWRMPAASPA